MKKRDALFSLLLFSVLPLNAQFVGDGFYRVQNDYSERYITITDNKASVNVTTSDADMGAIETVKPLDEVVSNPASVIYIKQVSSSGSSLMADLTAQGVSTYDLVKVHVNVLTNKNTGTYKVYATSSGLTKYLGDLYTQVRKGALVTVKKGDPNSNWRVIPIKSDTENYLGIKPEVSDGGSIYGSMYASYGINLANSGMKALYIYKVENGVAVYKEVKGIIPPKMPVIIKCMGQKVGQNKVEPVVSTLSPSSDNRLKGTFFNNSSNNIHKNQVAHDPATMRVLGITEDGTIGFVTGSGPFMAANRAWLSVPEGTEKELKLMSEEEYAEWLYSDTPSIEKDEEMYTGPIYNLLGVEVSSDGIEGLQSLTPGIYIIDGKKHLVP